MKTYRILQKTFGEGTKYKTSLFYPQIMDSHTLNDKIEPWEFYVNDKDESISFSTFIGASDYIEKQKAMNLPIITIIHPQ